jgi:hypothetical protein
LKVAPTPNLDFLAKKMGLNKNWNTILEGYNISFEDEQENEPWLQKFEASQLVKRVKNENLPDAERQEALSALIESIYFVSIS